MTELFKAVKDGTAQGRKVEDLQASIQLSMAVTPWVGDALLAEEQERLHVGSLGRATPTC